MVGFVSNIRTRIAVKGVGGLYTLYLRTQDGSLQEYATDVAEDAAIAATDVVVDSLDDLVDALPSASELGEIVGAATAAAVQATSSFSGAAIREIGPALVDSAELAYDAIAKKISGREADAIAGITVALLSIATLLFLYHEITRGPTP